MWRFIPVCSGPAISRGPQQFAVVLNSDRPGANFTSILQAAFTNKDPKILLGSQYKKLLMKRWRNWHLLLFSNVFVTSFSTAAVTSLSSEDCVCVVVVVSTTSFSSTFPFFLRSIFSLSTTFRSGDHQRFTWSFYARRSQRRKKLTAWPYFLRFWDLPV